MAQLKLARDVLHILLVACVVFGTCLVVVLHEPTHPNHAGRPFDRDAWLGAEPDSETGYSIRWPMARSIADEERLEGLTRTEVEALLGPPDDESRNDVHPYPAWDVGRSPSMSDSTALIVRFDASGRVAEVRGPW